MIDLKFNIVLNGGRQKFELNIDTSIAKGSFTTIYGPSGSGKTTLLRCMAGLETPNSGLIKVGDNIWFNDSKINFTPQKRGVGYVFQDYALFPNMTVQENLKFALKPHQDSEIIEELIEIMELKSLIDNRPDELSGGQKQRVALARALVQKPKILLLDEPLTALDAEIKSKLQDYILKLHDKYELTTLLVTHDISEILRMSDYLIELKKGKIVKEGTPKEIFGHREINSNFQFTGTVIDISSEDFIHFITVKIGQNLVKVVADKEEIENLNSGDTVLLSSKAFNPIIQKIS